MVSKTSCGGVEDEILYEILFCQDKCKEFSSYSGFPDASRVSSM